jgi:hypothetical protein
MSVTIKLDASGWQRAARDLHETSSRSCVDFTNGQALKVAIESVRHTEKANAGEIARILGATGRGVTFKTIKRGKNAGKVRTVRGGITAKAGSFAEAILIKRRVETGKWGVKGESLAEKVSNFIMARTRNVAFIAAGWIPARNRLFSAVKNKSGIAQLVAGVRKKGVDKGSAKPAVFSLRSKIQAIIENTALLQKARMPAPGGDPMPTATRGLQKAMDISARDMIQTLEKRLQPDFKKFNGK